jgi:hypothetical protein
MLPNWIFCSADQMIRRSVHKSVQALEADIRRWVDIWNENPRPFTWTKTADEILHSLAEYLDKIRASPPEIGQDKLLNTRCRTLATALMRGVGHDAMHGGGVGSR